MTKLIKFKRLYSHLEKLIFYRQIQKITRKREYNLIQKKDQMGQCLDKLLGRKKSIKVLNDDPNKHMNKNYQIDLFQRQEEKNEQISSFGFQKKSSNPSLIFLNKNTDYQFNNTGFQIESQPVSKRQQETQNLQENITQSPECYELISPRHIQQTKRQPTLQTILQTQECDKRKFQPNNQDKFNKTEKKSLQDSLTALALIQQNQDEYYATNESYQLQQSLEVKSQEQIKWIGSEVIGQGSFGKVFIGMNLENGKVIAVKQVELKGIKPTHPSIIALDQEIALLSKLQHKNIVQYYGMEKNQDHINIFLEFIGGGTLASNLKNFGAFQESLIRVYIKQILEGLIYLHSHGVIHRDIKGANVLIGKNGVCKLADFGSSKEIHGIILQDSTPSLCGTPNWMAPEVIEQQKYGRKADIWSLGCTMIEMATAKPPWGVFTNPFHALYQISQKRCPPPIPENLSDTAKVFLSICLKMNPKERWTAQRLLNHTWIQNGPDQTRNRNSSVQSVRSKASSLGRSSIRGHPFKSRNGFSTPKVQTLFAMQTEEVHSQKTKRTKQFNFLAPEFKPRSQKELSLMNDKSNIIQAENQKSETNSQNQTYYQYVQSTKQIQSNIQQTNEVSLSNHQESVNNEKVINQKSKRVSYDSDDESENNENEQVYEPNYMQQFSGNNFADHKKDDFIIEASQESSVRRSYMNLKISLKNYQQNKQNDTSIIDFGQIEKVQSEEERH